MRARVHKFRKWKTRRTHIDKKTKNDSLDCNQQDIKSSLVVCIIGLVPLSIHHLGVFLMF